MAKCPRKMAKGGGVKQNPPVKIDRSLYQQYLSKPLNTGNNVVSNDTNALNPINTKGIGLEYVSGSIKNKDITYKKGDKLYLYNEDLNNKDNQYGLVEVPANIQPQKTVAPITQAVPEKQYRPYVAPAAKPFPQIVDPTTVSGYNGVITDPEQIKALTDPKQGLRKGGRVMRKKYADGTDENGLITPVTSGLETMDDSDPTLNTGVVDPNPNDNITPTVAQNTQKGDSGQKGKNAKQILDAVLAGGTGLLANKTINQQQQPDDGFQHQDRTIANQTAAVVGSAAPLLNMVVPGAGTATAIAIPLYQGLKNKALDASQRIDPETGKYKNEAGAQVTNAIFNTPNAIKGLVTGGKGKNTLGAIEAENMAKAKKLKEEKAKADQASQTLAANTTIAQQRLEDGYKDGGVIRGKGGPKDDKINAELNEGDFIVPAENVQMAKMVVKHMTGKDMNKKAPLKKGSVPVKVSNGEMVIPKEEKNELMAKGVNMKALAPEAEENEDEHMMASGGEVGGDDFVKKEKAKIEAQYSADKKALSEAEAKARYEQRIRKMRVDVYNTLNKQLEDKTRAKKELEKAEAEYKAVKDSYETHDKQTRAELTPKTSGEKLAGSSKASPLQIRKEKEAILAELSKKEAALKKAKQDFDYSNNEKNYIAPKKSEKSQVNVKEMDNSFAENVGKVINPITQTSKTPSVVNTAGSTATNASAGTSSSSSKKAPVKTAKTTETASVMPSVNVNQIPSQSLAEKTDQLAAKTNPGKLSEAESALDNNLNTLKGSPPTKIDWQNILSSTVNYGVPLVQAAIGADYLSKQGARPVDKLSPDYLASIDKANLMAEQAKNNARYGYTPNEQFSIDQANQQATNSARYTARNMGVGAAGQFNLERAAINDSFGRSLSAKISDNQIKMQKQAIANSLQQQANEMVADKQSRLRNLFGDTLSGWQQNQGVGATLLNTGLNGILESARLSQFKKQLADENKNIQQ